MNRIRDGEINTHARLDQLRHLLPHLHWCRSSHSRSQGLGKTRQVTGCVAIEGDMEVDRLQEALQMLATRHLTLRRCLRSPVRGLRLWKHPRPVIKLEQEDIAGLTVEILDAMVREDSLRPLSEVKGCVCRGHLYRRAHNDWLLLLVVDSIATDTGSIARWLEELTELRTTDIGFRQSEAKM